MSIPAGHWIPHLKREGMNHLVMVENGELMGTASYCKSRFAAFDSFGEIVSIYLLPRYRGRGYGKQLLSAVMDELVQLGYRDIFEFRILKGSLNKGVPH